MRPVSLAAFMILVFLFTACGVLPKAIPPSPTPTELPKTATPTATAIPSPTATPTEDPRPKPGHWKGEPSVSFDLAANGEITNFSMKLKLAFSTCTVSSQAPIYVQEDWKTFQFVFGDTSLEDANLIRGTFTSRTTLTGSYSSSIICIDRSTGKGTISISQDEGKWGAMWNSE